MHGSASHIAGCRVVRGLILAGAVAATGGGVLAGGGPPVAATEVDQSGPGPVGQASQAGQSRPGGRGDGPSRGTPGMRPEWEWWKDAEYLKLANLTPQQTRHINDIYESRLRRMRPFAEEMVKEFTILNSLARERVATDEDFQVQAQRVSSLQGRLWESRQVMLYSLYRQLTADQYQKLIEVREARERRRQPGRGRAPR